MASEAVVSLAERLKDRREELGISQAQAARELDVARTAYRLWEMEAAKPAPDRWRLIAHWLGVSVTTMLLAEELLTEEEASTTEATVFEFNRTGRDWDKEAASKKGDFFAQARELIEEGADAGEITAEQAKAIGLLFGRIEEQSAKMQAATTWEETELRKTLAANEHAPRSGREAVLFVGSGIPEALLETARLLASELVSNSVRHGPTGPKAVIGFLVEVGRKRLRVEVSDGSAEGARSRQPDETGGYGLALVDAMASRWGSERQGDLNMTWFEIDLPHPGA